MTAHAARAALVLLALGTSGLAAQTWRTVEISRPLRDTVALSVRLEYAAGVLDVRPGAGASLYLMNLKYDADRSEPTTRYDAAGHSLVLGIRSHNMHYNGGQHESGSMHAELSTKVPMDLALELGAVQAEVQLGGMRLSELSVKSGAADVAIRFDQPNPDRLHQMTLECGAASLKVVRAGNSGVERVSATVGVGAIDLDLGGALARDVSVAATLAMGTFTLRVPRDVGVSVDVSTFLADFDRTGLVKRGDAWFTPGYTEATRKVTVRVKAFLGSFVLARDAP